MTLTSKVGVSFVYHMNDDMLEVDSFFPWMLPGSLLPPFLRREPEAEATVHVCCGEREREREREFVGKGISWDMSTRVSE